MPTKLSDPTVRKLKPAAEPYYVSDVVRKGLAIRVALDGSKSWSYRYRIGRRMRRVTFGDFPTLTLAEARGRAKDAAKQVMAGVDPAEQKQQRREGETVGDFADIFIAKYAKPRKKSWRDDQSMLKCDVVPQWQHKLMRDVTRRDVRVLLDGIVARGAPIAANRVHSLLRKVFGFAVTEDVIEANPVRDVPKPSKERIRDRVLSDDEIRAFWQTTESLAPALRALWRIRLLTAKRPGEVARMRWADLDLDAAWWVSPAAHEKNGLAHRVPVSAPVVQLLRDLRGAAPEGYVFAGVRSKRAVRVAFPLPDFAPKDLRKTAATRLSQHHVPDATIDAVLNHKKTGIIKVYNLHAYDWEKRAALDLWARVLDAIIHQTDGATVMPFARR